jgi:hypothetical protein
LPTVRRDLLRDLGEQYLCRIWPSFLSYLVVYELGIRLAIPAPALVRVFQVLHFSHLALLGAWVWQQNRLSPIPKQSLLFWLAVTLVLVLPGAYLEFPADPFEHFRRIFTWISYEKLTDNDVYERFPYFLGWSFLADLPIGWRRIGAGLYGALWQLLVLAAFFRLLKSFSLGRATCFIGTFSYLAFFGSGMFGLRYYALSPLAPALVALYGALELLLTQWRFGWRRCLALLIPPAVVMQKAHPGQEIANFVILAFPLVGFFLFQKQDAARRRALVRFAFWVLLGGLIFFLLLRLIGREWLSSLLNNYPISKWGSVSFLDARPRLFSTLGIAGVAGTACALLMLRTHPTLAILAIAPPFLLLWPPTSSLLMLGLGARGVDYIYRVLYAFPTACVFPIYASLKAPRLRWLIATAVLVLGSFPQAPFFGRLYFQAFRPPETLTLEVLDQTAIWLQTHRDTVKMRRKCRLISDDLTYSAVSLQLGLPLPFTRKKPTFEIQDEYLTKEPVTYLTRHEACGLLIVDPKLMVQFPRSEMALLSRHWSADFVQLQDFQPKQPKAMIETLTASGWSITPVAPWYLYLEPPVH